ncbi:MAG: hypothetical protein CMA50_00175 [Euryarchaeota archaeon]|nr:hypothetical protein [Euryarchaeota archaeon]
MLILLFRGPYRMLLVDTEETRKSSKNEDVNVRVPRAKRRRHQPIKVSNQIPNSRRKEIEKALEEPSSTPKTWARSNGWKSHRIGRKLVKPGTIRQIEYDLMDVEIGESWPIPITVVHGSRPGPVVTLIGAIHGNELVGPLALTYLQSHAVLGPDKAIDPATVAGTIRIIPIVNMPGYRRRIRYMTDGRDLNRFFPGKEDSNTTSRVANRLWNDIFSNSDHIVDLHTAALGRTNMPQIRANLANPSSNRAARSFGIEVILDSEGPKGSLRRTADDADISCITYEGGGADEADPESIQIVMYGILNVLRSLKVIPGYPSRPRFRLLASGSVWIRSDYGGLLDVLTPAGSWVEENELVATVSDPEHPGVSMEIRSPTDGLLICTATHPFVTTGTPIGHLLPISKGIKSVKRRLDDEGVLVLSGADGEPPWREDDEIEDISVEGEWEGGSPDAEWGENIPSATEEEADEA